jgi:predicted kinase
LKFCGRLKYENEQKDAMKSIIMMHGLPGTGKSFIAEKIAHNFLNAVVLKTVKFRDLSDSSPGRFDETMPKTREEKDDTYRQLIASAREALIKGEMPILDATFHKKYRRKWAYDLVREMNAKLVIISTVCEEDVVFERLKERESEMSEDAFLKSRKAFGIMKAQADDMNEEGGIVKQLNTDRVVDIEELAAWLKSILL